MGIGNVKTPVKKVKGTRKMESYKKMDPHNKNRIRNGKNKIMLIVHKKILKLRGICIPLQTISFSQICNGENYRLTNSLENHENVCKGPTESKEEGLEMYTKLQASK